MIWGRNNLTLLGAIRVTGWVVLSSMFQTANADRFVAWLKKKLLPKLRRGDVLVMDNLKAHHDDRVRPACYAFGVRAIYLPPYSPDLNPIEPGWAYRSSTCGSMRRVTQRLSGELRGELATESRPGTAADGSSTPATWFNPSDQWG